MNSLDCREAPLVIRNTIAMVGYYVIHMQYLPKYIYTLVVEVDLKAAHFKPGKANYERVKQCLDERLNQTVNFVLSWYSQGVFF